MIMFIAPQVSINAYAMNRNRKKSKKISKINSSYYDKQLKKGLFVEKEHAKDKTAKDIATTHLKENKDYYKYYNPKSKHKEYLVNEPKKFSKSKNI